MRSARERGKFCSFETVIVFVRVLKMSEAQRSRIVYTNYEKDILRELVKKYIHIVECKKTNKVSLQKKEEAWQAIEVEFNQEINVSNRDSKSLKKAWDNLKTRCKDEFAREKKALFKTGGGTDVGSKPSKTSLAVYQLVQHQIDPLENNFDDDAISNDSAHSPIPSTSRGVISLHSDAESVEQEPSNNNPDGIKNKKKRKATAQEIMLKQETEEHGKRMRLIDLKIEHEIIEHEARMENIMAEKTMLKQRLGNFVLVNDLD